MAAKKSRASKKTTTGSSPSSDSVVLVLDTQTVETLHAAIAALSELASALIMGSDDPGLRGKAAKKTAAKKTAAKKATKKAAQSR